MKSKLKIRDHQAIRTRKIVFAASNLSMKDIGDALGVSRQAVSAVVGERWDSYTIKAAVAFCLQIGFKFFWNHECEPPTQRQAKILREKLGLEFTGDKENRSFRGVEMHK